MLPIIALFITSLSLHYPLASTEYLKLPLLHKQPPPTPSQALALDTHRLSTLFPRTHNLTLKSPITSGASTGSGQYFINIRLGSPPQSLLLVADTGSDLIWTKCSACRNCTHRPPNTAFLVRHSSTFALHHCFQKTCSLITHPNPNPCNRTRMHSSCKYEYTYADGSTTSGLFGFETITLKTSKGSNTHLKKLNFGCGFQVSGPSVTGASFNGANGVMGLGRGAISFSSQLGRKFGNKFSYCLMDYTLSPPPTSYLTIGGGAIAASFTPLLSNPLAPTFYYISVEGIYVDNVKLKIDSAVWDIDENGDGGTVIDSGTTLSFLAMHAYKRVLAAMRRRVKLPRVKDAGAVFDLCVNVSGVVKPKLPKMSFRMHGGAWFSPPARNYFVETSVGVKCLGVQGAVSGGGFSVLGNLMQQGFLFEFDKDKSRLGFTRRGCGLP